MLVQIERELTADELVALVSEPPETTDMTDDVDNCDIAIEEIVTAPSLAQMRQQLTGFAAFMADSPQFTADDEMAMHSFTKCCFLVSINAISKVSHVIS